MKPAVFVSVLFLAIVAVLHALRLVIQLPVTVGGEDVPMWVSAVAAVFTGGLAVWLWRGWGE